MKEKKTLEELIQDYNERKSMLGKMIISVL